MDVHISIIEDFKTACPYIQVIDWCLSGHAWVMKRKQNHPDYINPSTWTSIDRKMIENFQTRYDRFLRTFDGFIVGYASVFAMIYEKYNKPIIMMNAVRYDVPLCWSQNHEMLQLYKECLHRLHSRNLLRIVSNNKADKLYTEKGLGLPAIYIPSLCDYTQVKYAPSRSTFLCYHGATPSHPLITQKAELPHPHSWKDITTFRGVISFPYEISLMSLFEQYTMGMPFFFPSKTYWKEHPEIQSMSAYWKDTPPKELDDLKDLNVWIENADMYDFFTSPNTFYFDSLDHLYELLRTFQYTPDTDIRRQKAQAIREGWKRLLS